MKRYQSDFTLFLDQLKKSKPEMEQNQLAGRALLWDKAPINPEDVRRDAIAKIKQRAYVYSND